MPMRAMETDETGNVPMSTGAVMNNSLKILVVDDHDIIRRGLKDLLTANGKSVRKRKRARKQ
jgi:PleD family two-component response regulator